MAIYRKKKFTSPKKVGGPEIGAAHKSKKVDGPRPARPNRLRRQCRGDGQRGQLPPDEVAEGCKTTSQKYLTTNGLKNELWSSFLDDRKIVYHNTLLPFWLPASCYALVTILHRILLSASAKHGGVWGTLRCFCPPPLFPRRREP